MGRALGWYRGALRVRRETLVPWLRAGGIRQTRHELIGERGLVVHWLRDDGSELCMQANLGDAPLTVPVTASAQVLLQTGSCTPAGRGQSLGPWAVVWSLRSPWS